MDLRNLFDIIESLAIGFAIVISIAVIGFIAYTILNFILMINIHSILKRLYYFLLMICILIVLGIIIYLIGKFAKKPLKNKINNNLNSFNQNSTFCKKCGTKIKVNAKFCDSCGENIKR